MGKGGHIGRVISVLSACALLAACGTRLSDGELTSQLRAAYGTVARTPGEPATRAATASAGDESVTQTSATTAASTVGSSGSSTTTSIAATKAPILIGMDGNWTGISGAIFLPSRDAVLAWANVVNAHGGIKGHPVRIIVTENSFNASRSLANIRDLVENQKVIALVNVQVPPGNDQAMATYLEQKHVPVISTEGATFDDLWRRSPVLFNTAPSDDAWLYAWAKAMADAGKHKVAVVYCVETTNCSDTLSLWRPHAKALGLDIVYEARVSVAQPDFTSQCLAARSNGAEAVLPILDGYATVRLAQNCDRQSYRPLLVNLNPLSEAPAGFDGMVAPQQTFPWFLTSGSPALDEYGAAMKKYVKDTGPYASRG